MRLNRSILAGAAVAAAVLSAPVAALAAEAKAFTAEAFAAAQAAGKPIVVEVHAPWCPVCKKQQPITDALAKDPKHAALARFHVDFDSQKSDLRRLGVQKQSTLIAYKDGKEVGRSTGVTDREAIAALFDKTL
jgi:thiol-disulfide isomerase/thioredoxin